MGKYAVFCPSNPCGTAENKWCIQRAGWDFKLPEDGVDINEAYSVLRWEERRHINCGCQFVVKELGE